MSIVESPKVPILIYLIKDSTPPEFKLYDVKAKDINGARQRIETQHPEYVFKGIEDISGADNAKEYTRAFNKAGNIYPILLARFHS